jgi:3-isopropylmalate/(R)-2-methylmalate dehydratase small subunit
VIARSFSDIFEQNAHKNQLLPAVVDAATHAKIVKALDRPQPPTVFIDLMERCIEINDQKIGSFKGDEGGSRSR